MWEESQNPEQKAGVGDRENEPRSGREEAWGRGLLGPHPFCDLRLTSGSKLPQLYRLQADAPSPDRAWRGSCDLHCQLQGLKPF